MGTCPENLLSELESYVVSCDNTVTYKWISQKWNVHVNTAKQLLYLFLDKEKLKENPSNFEVIYFLSGPLKNAGEGKSYQVCLVREKDVEKVKSQLQRVVSEHVYSIQKSSLKDLHALYVVDKANGDDILQGKSGKSAVKCEDAVPRAAEQVAPATSRNVKDTSKGSNSWDKSSLKSSTDSSKRATDLKNDKSNESGSIPASKEKEASKGIAGMFAAQSGKASSKKSETSAENATSKSDVVKKPSAKKSNGIASLFAKQAERPPAPKPKKEEPKKEEPKKEPKKTIVLDDEDPFASEEEEEVGKKGLLKEEIDSEEDRAESPVEPKGKAKKAKGKTTKEKKKKRQKHSDGEEESPLAPKKRRRIKMMASSEESSEEEMEVGESESPIPSKHKKPGKEIESDDEDIIPATPHEALGGSMGKKKIRKRVMVNKTFEDDQGYIVTKKEFAFESCSEDSNQSGDDSKASKEKALPNGKVNDDKDDGGGKNVAVKQNDSKGKVDADSPNDESKGKNSKETAKGKKAAGKKISPPSGRQGVLTSFFKRC